MGNAPSKEPQGRTERFHRLSKPRIASHQGTPPLLSPNGQLNTSNRSSDPGPDLFSIPYSTTAISTLSIDISRDDFNDSEKRNSFLAPPKPQRRRSLFRSKSSQESSERRRYRRNTVIGSPSLPSEPPVISRANSVNVNHLGSELNAYSGLASPDRCPPAGLRASWAYDLSSYEAQRILSLVPEQPPGLPRNNTSTSLYEPKLDGMKRPARRRDSLPVQPTSPPISRSHSEITLHPPMRRRSIVQTPGVATRSVRPGLVTSRTSYRHSLPATPNLSRQASFDGPDCRVVSLPPLPPIPASFRRTEDIPRVVTPTEADYSATGGFKFGTLRIINGSPEMTPSVPEPHGSQFDSLTLPAASLGYFTKLPPREEETSDSRLRRTQSFVQPAATEKPEGRANCVAQPEHATRAEINAPTLSVNVPSSKIEMELAPKPTDSGPRSPTSPVLITQSKHTAAEDQLFEAEDESEIELSTVEVLDVRVDPSARRVLSQRAEDTSKPGVHVIERSDSGFVSNAVSVSSNTHTSLAKADSGYSSSVSLRSFRSGRKPGTVERDAARGSAERAGEPAKVQGQEPRRSVERTNLTVNGESSGDERAPTPPPKDDTFIKPAKSTMAEDGHANPKSPGEKRVRKQPPAINTSRTDGRKMKKSESVPPTPASAKSDASESASSLSIASTSQKHGRLHRFLSLRGSAHSKAPLTVHVTHAVDKEVPSIPKDVEQKLHEHTGRFPMSAKRLALKSQLSQETLKTILSVGSLEIAKEDELPPTPTFFDDTDEGLDEDADTSSGDAKENSIRQTITSMQSNFKQAAASMMPNKKPSVLKAVSSHKEVPQVRSSHDTAVNGKLVGEADFTISASTSLGSNPYIANQATTEPQPRAWSGRSMTMTPRQESRQPLRTYSLSTVPSSRADPSPGLLSPSSPTSKAKKMKSPPPVSMNTRSLRRPPPPSPNSALRPQSPEALHGKGYEAGRNPPGGPSPERRTPSLNSQRSLDSVRRAVSIPGTLQYRTADWDPHTRQNSLGSDSSRHTSFSAQYDLPRGQTYAANPTLKRQSSIDAFSRNRQQGAHQGPGSSPSHAWSKPPSVHRRNLSTGSGPQHAMGNPPYRILHSYNSPAYRNAPIWG
ncbi:hypothetical protein Daus18300_013691 [Diaporthe australafricana]|uniref:Proteophosphoglycan ppg4 n=1 Tax=Diaporthe australafricana TaxID=127596 RepID=A0ABR3VY50_9PEZI